jgi:DNA-binding MltR family transcriptional regulator
MKSYSKQIIEKMKVDFYPSIGWDFIYSLTNESNRGAVLIGTAKVEEYIEKLIISVLPKQEKKYKLGLLKYPGALSSFSSKIELSFAFRLIDENLYNALNVLRKIRNKAAHTSEKFELDEVKKEIEAISNFEENFDTVINKLAFGNLEKMKKYQMRNSIKDAEGSETTKNKVLEEQFETLTTTTAFLEQFIVWKLSYALSFICIKILAIIDDLELHEDKSQTWIEIIENKNNYA